MATVYQYSKQSKTTYVYEATYRWDPDLKQSRSVRKLIGKVDDATGEIIPTNSKRGRPRKNPVPVDNPEAKADELAKKEELIACFQDQIKEKDLTIARQEQEMKQLQKELDHYIKLVGKIKAMVTTDDF